VKLDSDDANEAKKLWKESSAFFHERVDSDSLGQI
jgi:hypothetical protein